jgi:hypothetical protein
VLAGHERGGWVLVVHALLLLAAPPTPTPTPAPPLAPWCGVLFSFVTSPRFYRNGVPAYHYHHSMMMMTSCALRAGRADFPK